MNNHKLLKGYYRHDVVNFLQGNNNVGIELGVAEGIFSERMIKSGRFSDFIGIDMYSDYHDTNEYKSALKRIGLFKPYKIIRMKFDEALDLFDDQSIDFIYIDGYAHSGEEGGETIFQWWKKLKIGGVMAGDDYHPQWPLVIKSVDTLIRQTEGELMLTELVEDTDYCNYPSWVTIKKEEQELVVDAEMVSQGKSISRNLSRKYRRQIMFNKIKTQITQFLKN